MSQCCRWCKWFDKGFCRNDAFEVVDLHVFWENGDLISAVEKWQRGVTFIVEREALIECVIDALIDFETTLANKVAIADEYSFSYKNWE